MKTRLNVKGIQIGELKIGDIVLEQEYTVAEAVNMMNAGKQFVKELVKDLPEMLLDLEGAYETMQEIDERQSESNETLCESPEEFFTNFNPELEEDRKKFFEYADLMAHHKACQDLAHHRARQEAEIDDNRPCSDDEIMDMIKELEQGNPNVKVRVVGPRNMNEEDIPEEVKDALKHVIGQISRKGMR